jgi:PhnB protein
MSVAPAGYTTAVPWIVTRDTRKLFEFITDVFDGVELGQVPFEDGSIGHAEIRVGDTALLAFDQPEGWPDEPSLLRVFVADADATTEAALSDPFGNIWWITAVVEDVAPDEAMRRLSDPVYAEAMREAQETLDRELRR